jgi:hypothetical protein
MLAPVQRRRICDRRRLAELCEVRGVLGLHAADRALSGRGRPCRAEGRADFRDAVVDLRERA